MVTKLVKGKDAVWVDDDPSEASHKLWREKGFAPEGEQKPAKRAAKKKAARK